MNNYYTLFHLLLEIHDDIVGKKIAKSITPRKDVLEIYIKNGDERGRIVVDTGNIRPAIFLDEYRPEKRSNVLHFFESIEGRKINKIGLAQYDRLISVELENETCLQIVLFGPRANIFLIKDGIIRESFKSSKAIGQPALQPAKVTLWREPDNRSGLKKNIQRINPLLPREWIPDIIEAHHPGNNNADELVQFVQWLTEELETHPSPRILDDGRFCLFPERVVPHPSKKRFENINDAIRTAYYSEIRKTRLQDTQEQLLTKLRNRKSSRERQLKELKNIDKSLARAEKYEQAGHLLMANIHRKELNHQPEIRVQNMFQENEWITIPLKTELDLAENAQNFYDKSKKSRKSYEMALSRKSAVSEELQKLERLIVDVLKVSNNYELQKWIKTHRDELEELGITGTNENQVHRPFHKTMVGKYEIWIGKNAKSNDELTLSAHKEDIWLHARGVSGSHVVIRMNNNKNYPPKEVLLKVASLAAYYSKARGSAMAPVSYTKKKFVRKPKGASPGLVYLDREEVLMVEPKSNAS